MDSLFVQVGDQHYVLLRFVLLTTPLVVFLLVESTEFLDAY